MSYRLEKNGESTDIVISGWELGIGRSPLSGIGNMQAVNINTETKEVMCSYARVQQSMTNTTANGTLTASTTSTTTTTGPDGNTLKAGVWITVSASTISGLSTGNYYVRYVDSGNTVYLSQYYNSDVITGLGLTGTATYSLLRNWGKPIAKATESYVSNGTRQYRYYILDANGLVWVYDSGIADVTRGLTWFLPDYSIAYFSGSAPTGICILGGWLHVFAGSTIYVKPTVNLGDSTSTSSTYATFVSGAMQSIPTTPNPHFAFVGGQGKAYYTDGTFVGSIFPNSSLLSGTTNVQSYASYTASTTTGTIANLFEGSTPTSGATTPRIPVVFFTSETASASLPSAISANTVYYLEYSKASGTFEAFAALTGGSALNLQTGAVGTQYFNTYYPGGSSGSSTIVFTPIALILHSHEIATAITEVGNTLIIGGRTNTIYPWNQVDPTPSDLIPLPENNVAYLLTVNNMVYIFAGNKGNIYITNGSAASLVLSLPDYTAGIAGTKGSYIEPYFIWGGADYIRGRVFFSIQDQTSSKTGNCGGVWSFVPSQNFFYGQDTGLSLRMENKNSYNTFNGAASVIIGSEDQQHKGPIYWSGWYSNISSSTYGVDYSLGGTAGTSPTLGTAAVIETDLIPVGTMLNKTTFEQIEYKLSAPLTDGESVSISWRQNSTDEFTSAGTVSTESSTGLSGYYQVNFEKGQWLQLQITLTPNTSTLDTDQSFVRLVEVRIR